MNQETFHRNPLNLPPKAIGVGLAWLAAYALLAAALGALLYKFSLVPMFVVPVLAEGVLVKSMWTSSAFWCGLLARFLGLTVAGILLHYRYVIPVIYEGGKPWSEEYLWAYVIVGGQTAVAAIILFVIKRLFRKRLGSAS